MILKPHYYVKWFKGLSIEQFNEIVTAFIKNYWNYPNVILVDGPNDGGLDFKIYENKRKKSIPLQTTTDLNTYNKLKKDLKKISDLIDKYGYESKFHFFYSGSASEGKLLDLVEHAKTEYDIDLEIIDSKIIGGIAENIKYSNLKQTIIKVIDIKPLDNTEYFNKFDKLKYDVYTYGEDAHDIKSSIADSFIINTLYINGKSNKEDVKKTVNEEININGEGGYCDRRFQELIKVGKISISGTFDEFLELSSDETERLNKIKNDIDFQEQYFATEISSLIKNHNLSVKTADIISKVHELYKESYQKDFLEINELVEEDAVEKNILSSLQKYIFELTKDWKKSEKVGEDLFEICSLTDFLQRIASTDFFCKMIDNNDLEAYLNKQPKSVFLDTSVLLYLICSYYNKNSSFDNIYYKVTNNLLDYTQKGDIQIKLHVSFNYLKEVAYHILNAYRLNTFMELGIFDNLGKTSNIFINFFQHLDGNDELEYDIEDFKDFLSDFGFDYELSNNEEESLQYLAESLESILEENDVEVIEIPDYFHSSNKFERKVYGEIKKELELIHTGNGNNRPELTVINDTFMLCYFYNKYCEHPDSFLLTWDNSFSQLRQKYHRKHPKVPFWHLFRPGKLLDHFTLLNFKPDSSNLSLDLLSIVENDFDIQGKVRSLNDLLVRIIDLKSKSGISLAKGIMEIRTKEVYNVKRKHSEIPDFKDIQPIDNLLLNVNSYYKTRKGKYTLNDFKNILSKEENIDIVLQLIEKEINFFTENSKFSNKIYQDFDALIKEQPAPNTRYS